MRIATSAMTIALAASLLHCGSGASDQAGVGSSTAMSTTGGSAGSGGDATTGPGSTTSSTNATTSSATTAGGAAGTGDATSGVGGSGGAGGSSGGAGGTGGSDVTDGGPPSMDAGTGKPTLDPEIGGAVGSVSSTRVGSAINTLAGFTTRNTCSNDTSTGNTIGAARDWVKAQFQSISGLKVSLDNFPFGGCAGGMVTDQNVVAVKLGAHPDRVVIVGGHYDSRTLSGTDPTSPAPGANDSGSQTAAVLEIARALAPLQFDATLLFVAFAAEEQGLVGSANLAKDYATYVTPTAKVEAMLNLDIVGGDNMANTAATLQQFRLFSPGTPREFNQPMGVTDDTSPARGIMRYVGYWGGAYVPSMTMLPVLREDRQGRGGDQESFNNVGIPAVRFIETVESPNAATLMSHQHSPNDLPMYVTPAYTARIAQVVTAVAASLARAPTVPEMATAMGTGPWTLNWTAPASGPAVDHYVIAARPNTENLYRTRVAVAGAATSHSVTAADLGLAAGTTFFVSIAAVDAKGHESLFAYPEYRCDAASCVVQPGSLDITARN